MPLIIPQHGAMSSSPSSSSSVNDSLSFLCDRERFKTAVEFRNWFRTADGSDSKDERVSQLLGAVDKATFPALRTYHVSISIGSNAPPIHIATLQVGAPDDSRYRKHAKLLKWVRRGMTILRFGDSDQYYFQFGLRKFFYSTSNDEQHSSWDSVFTPFPEEESAGLAPGVFVTVKENGEFFRVSLAHEPTTGQALWVIASKNVPVFLRVGHEEADLQTFATQVSYSYAIKMARHWLGEYNRLSLTQQEALVALLSNHTIIGEFCGGVDQHLKLYTSSAIICFALVDQSRFDINCVDPEVALERMKDTGVQVVESSFHSSIESLRENLRTVRTGPMDQYGEGAVLYVRQPGGETLCFKYKTEEYVIARLAREFLRKDLDILADAGVVDVEQMVTEYHTRIKGCTDNQELIAKYLQAHTLTLHYILRLLYHSKTSAEALMEEIRHAFIDLTQAALHKAVPQDGGSLACPTPCAACQGAFTPTEPGTTAPLVIACSSPPGAGKSTLLRATADKLKEAGIKTKVISLDLIMRACKTDRGRRAAFAKFQDDARRALLDECPVVLLDMCFSTSKVQAQVKHYFNAIGVRVVFKSLVPLDGKLKTMLLILSTARVLARTVESHDGSTLVPALAGSRGQGEQSAPTPVATASPRSNPKSPPLSALVEPGAVDDATLLAPPSVPGFDEHSATSEELLTSHSTGALECIKVVSSKLDSASAIAKRDVLHIFRDTDLKMDAAFSELATTMRGIMNKKVELSPQFLEALRSLRTRVEREACRPLDDVVTDLTQETLALIKDVVPISQRNSQGRLALGPKLMYAGAFVSDSTRAAIKEALGIDGEVCNGSALQGSLAGFKEFIDHVTLMWKGRSIFMSPYDASILHLCTSGDVVCSWHATHVGVGRGDEGSTIFLRVQVSPETSNNPELAPLVDPEHLGSAVLHLTLYCNGPAPAFAKQASQVAPKSYWTQPGDQEGAQTFVSPDDCVEVSVIRLAQPICFETSLGIV